MSMVSAHQLAHPVFVYFRPVVVYDSEGRHTAHVTPYTDLLTSKVKVIGTTLVTQRLV